MSRTVILDNEAVQALLSPSHRKHARALAAVRVVVTRKKKGPVITVVVPAAVRVEAGWSRTDPRAAFINLLGILDVPLNGAASDVAAGLVATYGVSVADAHVGAVVAAAAARGPVTVVTSDPKDIRTVAGAEVTIVTL